MGAPKIPAVVEVGPFVYGVITEEIELRRIEATERAVLAGHTNHDRQTITLDVTMANGQIRETLLHEALHVVAVMTGLSRDWGKDREEDVIRRLSPALLDLLRRNPALVAFLMAAES